MSHPENRSSAIWICHIDGAEVGPLTAIDLNRMVREGRIGVDTRVKKKGDTKSTTVKRILQHYKRKAQPRPRPDWPGQSTKTTNTSSLPKRELVAPEPVEQFAVARDSSVMVVGSSNGQQINLLDIETGKLIHRWHSEPVTRRGRLQNIDPSTEDHLSRGTEARHDYKLRISPDGRRILISTPSKRGRLIKKFFNRILLCDTSQPNEMTTIAEVDGVVESLEFGESMEIAYLAWSTDVGRSTDSEVNVETWNLAGSGLLKSVKLKCRQPVYGVAISEQSQVAAVATFKKSLNSNKRGWQIHLWDLQSGELRSELHAASRGKQNQNTAIVGFPHTLCFSRNGDRVFAADGWDLRKDPLAPYKNTSLALFSIPLKVSARLDAHRRALKSNNIRCWDTNTGVLCADINTILPDPESELLTERAVQRAALSPDGNFALTASWDNLVHLWSLKKGCHIVSVFRVTNSELVELLANSYFDEKGRPLDPSNATHRKELKNHIRLNPLAYVSRVAFSFDGKEALISLENDSRIHVIPLNPRPTEPHHASGERL